MSQPLFNFRLPRQDHKAVAKAASELHCDRSSLARLALHEYLGRLQREGLISEAPSAYIFR